VSDLAEWLLARIAEDEEAARAAVGEHFSVSYSSSSLPVIWHIDRWTSARVLAECAAKRRIVELHRHEAKGPGPVLYDGSRDLNEGVFGCVICSCVDDDPGWHFTGGWCQTVRLLALPYASREGYDERWRPEQ
jgi:hypothetical protein